MLRHLFNKPFNWSFSAGRKEKRSFGTSRANWENSIPLHQRGCVGRRWTLGTTLERRRLGLCWTPVDTRDRAGPGDAWLARRRRYSTARRDRAHNLKEAKGRAGTVRFNQRSSNALYCRVNERMNNEMRRDSCSSSLINFVLNLSKLFLVNHRMSSS